MDWITTLDDLHSHYGQPAEAATVKVTPHLTPAYRAWIDRSRFCILTTVGPEGTDGSPAATKARSSPSSIPRRLRSPTGTATTASTACATSSAMAASA